MPWRRATVRRSADASATQTVAPTSRSTRKCFSPQRPRPISRTFIGSSVVDEIAAHVLDDFVAEQATLHPADGQQIRARHGRAAQQAVLGPSEAARAMVHRHLDYSVAAHLQHRRDEAVQTAIEDEPAQALAAKRAERAAAVLDGLVGQPV